MHMELETSLTQKVYLPKTCLDLFYLQPLVHTSMAIARIGKHIKTFKLVGNKELQSALRTSSEMKIISLTQNLHFIPKSLLADIGGYNKKDQPNMVLWSLMGV